jgi:predicted nucleic acid-binding protein
LTPASGKFLLDTNIIIALLEGDDAVLSNLDRAVEVFIPAVAVGELFFWSREIQPAIRKRRQS